MSTNERTRNGPGPNQMKSLNHAVQRDPTPYAINTQSQGIPVALQRGGPLVVCGEMDTLFGFAHKVGVGGLL